MKNSNALRQDRAVPSDVRPIWLRNDGMTEILEGLRALRAQLVDLKAMNRVGPTPAPVPKRSTPFLMPDLCNPLPPYAVRTREAVSFNPVSIESMGEAPTSHT